MTIGRGIPSDAPTPPTALAAHTSVTADCRACNHAQPLDLAKLVGLPGMRTRRCLSCRSAALSAERRGHRVIVCGARLPG